jgi:hypothetical protein
VSGGSDATTAAAPSAEAPLDAGFAAAVAPAAVSPAVAVAEGSTDWGAGAAGGSTASPLASALPVGVEVSMADASDSVLGVAGCAADGELVGAC